MATSVLLCVLGYLFASISFAWLAARGHGIDLRQIGSGNLGATNVGRALGWRWFAVVFIADMSKGLLPVLAMHWWLLDQPDSAWWLLAAGASAVAGHVWPCWHGFRGGKAVATSLGVILAVAPVVAAAALGVWLVSWVVGRLCGCGSSNAVGPASVVAAIAAMVIQYGVIAPRHQDHLPVTLLITLAGFMIIWRHRKNLSTVLARRSPPT